MFKGIISTLDTIEVHGKDNLDKLLGCILLLESMQQKLENDLKSNSEQSKEKKGEVDG